MREDHAGCIHFIASRTISRGCTSTWLNVPEKGGYVSVPGFVVEKDHHKDLPLQIGELALQKFAGHVGVRIGSSSSIRTL